MTAAELYLALLSLYPVSPARACLQSEAQRTVIVETLEASARQYRRLPGELLLAVGFAETHLGCDPHSEGGWGAILRHRPVRIVGTPMHAARALHLGYQACRSWAGAVRRFRTGTCRATRTGLGYQRMVFRVVRLLRVHHRRLRAGRVR